jgi:hypothetical protein
VGFYQDRVACDITGIRNKPLGCCYDCKQLKR